MPLPKDLLHPSPEEEKRKHKKQRLLQSPNSYFVDVKCPGCYSITTVCSHAQTVVLCVGCSLVLCQPTGGKARLAGGSFRRKQHEEPLPERLSLLIFSWAFPACMQ
ncbi:40S ribosomal protein S27-like [Echinops telfairi]|uniref:40S ribosomal protein S27-like n=1 Tax=Echinops telfairi TaxID=9371 RepID=A0ABM0J359_ECHTE|nr:40S ribosomal protein S27-like [Echinops telfairi]